NTVIHRERRAHPDVGLRCSFGYRWDSRRLVRDPAHPRLLSCVGRTGRGSIEKICVKVFLRMSDRVLLLLEGRGDSKVSGQVPDHSQVLAARKLEDLVIRLTREVSVNLDDVVA